MADPTRNIGPAYAMQPVGARVILRVLSRIVDGGEWADAVAMGICIALGQDDRHQIFLPVHRNQPQVSAERARTLRENLVEYVRQEGGFRTALRSASQSSTPDRGARQMLAPALAAVALACITGARLRELGASPRALVLFDGYTADRAAQSFADIVRRGRNAEFVLLGDAGASASVCAVFLDDSVELMGSVSTYFARGDIDPDVRFMAPCEVGSSTLWLPHGARQPDDEMVRDLAVILSAGTDTPEAAQFAFLPDDGAGAKLFALGDPEPALHAVSEMAQDGPPIQPFDLKTMEMLPDATAHAELARKIADQGHRVGYEVALVPVRRGGGPDGGIATLRAQIEALEERIAEITRLGAPQTRLLRFSDAQLPAMIDALRRLPPGIVADPESALHYAAGHSAGRVEPAHYLRYDPADLNLEVLEATWRARTEDRSIAYWLEPFVAHARQIRETRTQVFVPAGHFLAPSLAHFGGDVDETLQLILGNLFDELPKPDRDETGDVQMFLFSPSPDPMLRLEVEYLDARTFAPVRQHLPWLNDYLQVRGPNAVDRAQLADVAANLYEGHFAEIMAEQLRDTTGEVEGAWDGALSEVEGTAAGLLGDLIRDMERSADRIADIHRYLGEADRYMRSLETTMTLATSALSAGAQVPKMLAGHDAAMTRERKVFADRIQAEIGLGEKHLEQAERRIEALRARLDRIRDWGRR